MGCQCHEFPSAYLRLCEAEYPLFRCIKGSIEYGARRSNGRMVDAAMRFWGWKRGAGEALPTSRKGEIDPLVIFLGLALAIGVARRLLFGWSNPLWLDETYTGAFALQSDPDGVVKDWLSELSGPVYYGLIWAWTKLAGVSNEALRLPSLVFAIAAPLLILWRGHPDRSVRMVWAALAVLWVPSFTHALEARAYTWLFLLGTAQAILFRRLLDHTDLRRALAWCVVSAALILTHYHTLVLTGLQGLAFLAFKRERALRTWPAALLFIPVAAWMVVHLPLVIRYSDPNIAWQALLHPGQVRALPDLLIGGGRLGIVPLFFVAMLACGDLGRWLRRRELPPYLQGDLLTALASVAAIALVFGMGFFRPSFTPRYLIPFMPGFLFGLALVAARWQHLWRPAPSVLIGLLLLIASHEFLQRSREPEVPQGRYVYSWEGASEALRAQGARRLVFMFDNPATAIGDKAQLARVGAFFFHRADRSVPAEALILAGKTPIPDPRAAFIAATPRRGDAFIWVADLNVNGTLARSAQLRPEELQPAYQCRHHGRDNIMILACIRRSERG